MKKILTGLLCLVTLFAAAGGEDNYAVSAIPAALLKDANVIKRMETLRYEITEKNRAVITRKVAYTILNELGDQWAANWEYYSKLRSIESFEGTLYDASGKKIRSLKKSDIKDYTGGDDGLIDDYRYKHHVFYYKTYPFTVVYETEVHTKSTMFSPDWIPQEKTFMSVQSCLLTVVSPVSNPVRFKMFNYKGQPSVTEEKSNRIYTWQVKDIPAVESEYASPAWHEITTSVFLATEKFMLGDYEGSNVSWKDFGLFEYNLKKDRDELPDALKRKVHELTDGLPGNREKIAKLYEYMQQNTRYISIQLGIGGWQPFDAKFVAEKKYGDCKALSNFMFSLLKEAGIRSVYVSITSGDDDNYLLVDFPSSQFNHVILFVPDGKDTIWLECTSQTLPAGYLSSSGGNRYAVAVEETGGSLVRTPRYGREENLRARHIEATLTEAGTLQATIHTRYRAERQDGLHRLITNLSRDKIMEYLRENIELATYDVKNFSYNQEKAALPVINEDLELVVENYGTVSGKRVFITPNVISRTPVKLKPDDNRKFDLVLNYEFRDIDSTEITVPSGYTPEAIPQDIKVESKFGKYSASVKLSGNKITYYRNYEHFSGRFPPSDYAELVKFYEAIHKADRSRVVLVKNETTTQQKAF
jgi:hypothetical protein